MKLRHLLTALAVVVFAGVACDDDNGLSPSPGVRTFRVQACGNQLFNVQITDPVTANQARDLIGQTDQPVLTGRVLRGNGGFNPPWSWRLDPDTVRFADATIEVCDGCPTDLERDLDYWVGTVGQYCPWSSRVIAELD